jgi:hypothetical protein
MNKEYGAAGRPEACPFARGATVLDGRRTDGNSSFAGLVR